MEARIHNDAPVEASGHRLRFELIFASAWLAFGLFVLPAAIFWVGSAMLGPYGTGDTGMGTFYGDFYGDLAAGSARAWGLALGPLVLASLLRAVFWRRQPVQSPSRIESPPGERRVTPGADSRRVEPRVGSD